MPTDQIRVVDISSNNGPVDLAGLQRAGIAAVIIKATEGTTYVNPYFAGQWAEARRLGLGRGAYHFALQINPFTEAAHFADTVRAAGGWQPGDMLWDDVEIGQGNLGPSTAEFCAEAARRLFATTCGWYSGLYFAESHGLLTVPDPDWIAAYQSTPPAMRYVLWQYTDAISIGGKSYDCSIFNGSLAQLRALFGAEPFHTPGDTGMSSVAYRPNVPGGPVNEKHIVVRGTDNACWHIWGADLNAPKQPPAPGATSWVESLGGQCQTQPSIAWSADGNRCIVVVAGGQADAGSPHQHAPWFREWTVESGTWSPWAPMHGMDVGLVGPVA